MNVKYPNVIVPLTQLGGNANAGAIVGAVTDALAAHLRADSDLSAQQIQQALDGYRKDAYAGDYQNLLQVTMQTVVVM